MTTEAYRNDVKEGISYTYASKSESILCILIKKKKKKKKTFDNTLLSD